MSGYIYRRNGKYEYEIAFDFSTATEPNETERGVIVADINTYEICDELDKTLIKMNSHKKLYYDKNGNFYESERTKKILFKLK